MPAILRYLCACAVLFMSPAYAEFGQHVSHSLDGQRLSIATTRGDIHLKLINPNVIYAHFVQPGVEQLPSFALAGDIEPTQAFVSESADHLSFGSESLTARIDKSTLTISYFAGDQLLVAEELGYFAYPTQRGFRFTLQDGEKLAGGGQRVLGMDRRGHSMPLYNRAHYGYNGESHQMYYSLPAVMSSRGYALVFDNSATGRLDIGHDESDVLLFEARAGRTAYLIAAGQSPAALTESLTHAIGRQPLPPRWAFGSFASRFGYRSEAETRAVVDAYRELSMPLDAIVLDLYWFGPEIFDHMGNLDWDREQFPDPVSMMADFANLGVQTILISEPFVLTTSKRWGEAIEAGAIAQNLAGAPRLFDFYFGNTGLIDIFKQEARDWLWSIYEALFTQGMAGVWGDLGEPEVHPDNTLHTLSDSSQVATGDEVHNVYGHEWARLVYEQQRATFPDRRPFIMMRSGFAGTQRYGIIPWTGDVDRSWGGLAPQVELSLQMGLFGLGYIHSDLGGFAGGEKFDRELYLRWLQMGVFQPVFRPHAQEQIAPEPVYHDRKTQDLVRGFLSLRYSLLPYLQTLAYQNTTRGWPLVRPVTFLDDAGPEWFDNTESYLFGDAFLVRPIVEPGRAPVTTRMPPGVWFDWWNGQRIESAEHSRRYPLDEIPTFVRAGAFVPMVAPTQTTRDYSTARMQIHYFDDLSVDTASGVVYDDDGVSPDSIRDGQFELLKLSATRSGRTLTIRGKRAGDRYAGSPESRELTLIIHNHDGDASEVRIDGGQWARTDAAHVTYAPERRTLSITLTQTDTPFTLEIRQ